jgi:ParB family chromosome partitioning protein
METRMELLLNISGTDPNRDMGPLDKLKESLSKTGLINPLTIDTKGNLLAGRRRYKAMIELGWEECLVRVLDPKDEIEALMISLHENLRRKPLTEAENRRMITEIDELMRAKHGESKAGGNRQSEDGKKQSTESVEWSSKKTGEKLGIGEGVVRDAKRAKAHVEKHPELAREKTPVILEHKSREELLTSLPKNDRDYFKAQEEKATRIEIKAKVACAEEIEEAIEKIPDSGFKQTMEKKYRSPYVKFEESPESVKKAIRKSQGLDVEEKHAAMDALDRKISNWQDEFPELDRLLNTQDWRDQIREIRDSIKSLKRVDLSIEKFGSHEIAEEYASSHGGYCAGGGVVAGKRVWTVYVEDESND